MKTLIQKSIAVCTSLRTTAGRTRLLSVESSLSFAEGILSKYANMLPADISGAMMVYFKTHSDDADSEKKRRENIMLALKLVFVKYLASQAKTEIITVNNTLSDYISTSSRLVNEKLRTESPHYYNAVSVLEKRFSEITSPDEAADVIFEYLDAPAHFNDRYYFFENVNTALVAEAADRAGLVLPADRTFTAEDNSIKRISSFSEFVFRKNTTTSQEVPAAEKNRVQLPANEYHPNALDEVKINPNTPVEVKINELNAAEPVQIIFDKPANDITTKTFVMQVTVTPFHVFSYIKINKKRIKVRCSRTYGYIYAKYLGAQEYHLLLSQPSRRDQGIRRYFLRCERRRIHCHRRPQRLR